MSRRTSARGRFAGGLCGGLLACLAAQALWLATLGPAGRAESNYFSSLLRLQAAARGQNRLCVVGSSITGRLPGREVGREGVANLGIDGGSMADGLKLLNAGVMRPAPLVIVETNTLQAALEQGPSRLTATAGGLWFRAGVHVPAIGAAARPSALLYERLLRRPAAVEGEPFMLESAPKVLEPLGPRLEAAQQERLDDIIRHCVALREQGVKLCLVEYPAGPVRPEFAAIQGPAIATISGRAGVPFVDLSEALPRGELHFTDRVHLAPDSAARILTTLEHLAAAR